MKPWVVYIRVSTEEQAEAGASLSMQRDQCTAMATALGHTPADVLCDDGWSGKDLKRPAMAELLDRVRGGSIDGIIVWKLDRLTRSLRDLLQMVDLLAERNIALVSLHEKIDTGGPMGRFVLSIMGAVAQLERETIAQRVGASMRHLRSKGFWVGGRPPPGTRIIGDKGKRQLEVVPAQAAAVRQAFDACVAGVPLTDLAKTLHHAGVTPTLRTPSNIGAMLRNQHLVELGIVPAALFALAGAALGTRRPGVLGRIKSPGRMLTATRVWPLSGLTKCARCGASIVGAYAQGRSARYPYLRCSNRLKKRCDMPDLPAAAWESQVIAGIRRAVHHHDWITAWTTWCDQLRHDAAPIESDWQRLTLERDQAAAKIARLLAFIGGGSPGAVTRDAITALESTVGACDQALHTLTGRRVASTLLDQRRQFVEVNLIQADKHLETASPEKINDILRGIVSTIILQADPPSLVIELYVPGPEGGPGSYDLSRMVQRSKQAHEPLPRLCYDMETTRKGAQLGLAWKTDVGLAGRLVGQSSDIAQVLGVSRRTAQRLLAGRGSVGRLTQARIEVGQAEFRGQTSV